MGVVVGIDLGTTRSCVAAWRDGRAEVLPAPNGDRTIPSVVARTAAGEWLVGAVARRQAVTNAAATAFGVKRLVGRKLDDPALAAWRARVPYRVVAGDNGDAMVELGGARVSAEEISARVLRALRESAERALGDTVEQAVLTVPAYFTDAQRQATRDAGAIAGLDVLAILNEPTAAALACGVHGGDGARRVAVFDLGGGTFDVSIVAIERGVFEVLATAGDTFLGGEDFDRVIVDELIARARVGGSDLRGDATALQRLHEAAEILKRDLSAATTATYQLPYISVGPGGPVHLDGTLDRAWLEAATAALLARVDAPCRRALADAGVQPGQLDHVVLVGGMTRMPAVLAHVEALFGARPARDVNPDEVVALGAAVHAATLTGAADAAVLVDVTPHSLGIEVGGGAMSVIIERNTSIPATATRRYKTLKDGQRHVRVQVYQGEAPRAADNAHLGGFTMAGLPARPAGEVELEVTFQLDSDGIARVTAVELATGKQTAVTVTPAAGLSRDRLRELSEPAPPQPTTPGPSAAPAGKPPPRRRATTLPFFADESEHFIEEARNALRASSPSGPAADDPAAEFADNPTLRGTHAPARQTERLAALSARARRTSGMHDLMQRARRASGGFTGARARPTTGRLGGSKGAPAPQRDPVERDYEHAANADLFGQLGIHWTDPPHKVKTAIESLRRKYGPQSTNAQRSPEFAAKRLELAENAYLQLDEPATRRRYRADVLRVDAKQAAELLTQQARLDIRRNDYHDARDKLLAALDLEPTPERRALLKDITLR